MIRKSPSDLRVRFGVGGQLKKVSISGGEPVTLCDASRPFGASWGADDRIVFGQGAQGIWQVRATGGTKQLLISSPVPIIEGVRQAASDVTGAAQFSFSRLGSLVYVPDISGERTLLWVDREGHKEPLATDPRSFPIL